MDYSKITNIEFEDINHKDYPDYVDAFISYAEYDGQPMTESQLDEINENSDFLHEELINYLN